VQKQRLLPTWLAYAAPALTTQVQHPMPCCRELEIGSRPALPPSGTCALKCRRPGGILQMSAENKFSPLWHLACPCTTAQTPRKPFPLRQSHFLETSPTNNGLVDRLTPKTRIQYSTPWRGHGRLWAGSLSSNFSDQIVDEFLTSSGGVRTPTPLLENQRPGGLTVGSSGTIDAAGTPPPTSPRQQLICPNPLLSTALAQQHPDNDNAVLRVTNR